MLAFASMVGIGYAHAKQLVRQGDQAMQAQRYGDAITDYQEAGLHFASVRDRVAPQLALAKKFDQQQGYIEVAQTKMNASDWQGCLEVLQHITRDNPGYQTAQRFSTDCQQKLADATKPATVATQTQPVASPMPTPSPTQNPTKSPTTAKSTPRVSPSPSRPKSSPKASIPASSTSLASCSGKNYFSVSPVAASDIRAIVPLGSLNPSSHTFPTNHIYFYLRTNGSTPVQTALYAPGNITITSITASEHVSQGYTDYVLDFSPCAQITGLFDHVTSLSQAIQKQFDSGKTLQDYTYSTGGDKYHKTQKKVAIALAAGAQIGTTGGRAGQNALDVQVEDTRTSLTFANNNRWTFERHIVCPLDYYTGSIADTLMNLVGDYSGTIKRTASPRCGQYDQDVSGTPQGVWFKAGTTSTYPEDPHLALVHDNIDPNYGAISVGTTLAGVSSSVYYFTPAHTGTVNRDFAEVKDDQVYCYDVNMVKGQPGNTSFILQLSGSKLKIQKNASPCGAGPWGFGGTASDFER